MNQFPPICDGQIVTGSRFNKAMRVDAVRADGDETWATGQRITSVLVLPHPDRQAPEVRTLRQNPQTEAISMQAVLENERAIGRQVGDVHEKNLGYDITNLDLNSGELRPIEVERIGAESGSVLLTPNELRVAQDCPKCFWLYVATGCDSQPTIFQPINNPARLPWGEVFKVRHSALTLKDARSSLSTEGAK